MQEREEIKKNDKKKGKNGNKTPAASFFLFFIARAWGTNYRLFLTS